MKNIYVALLVLSLFSCGTGKELMPNDSVQESTQKISQLLEGWHDAATNADFINYFDKMTKESIFIGTDATENWNKDEFMVWSKPYFNRGTAWDFTAVERNIFLDESGEIAWFDELLDTQMGLARGSGVVVKEGDLWKIKHYVLSLTVPNEKVSEVTALKKTGEAKLFSDLKQ